MSTKAIPADRNLDTVTAAEWRAADERERGAFWAYWNTRGFMAFCCLNCGFPTSRGVASCEACRDLPQRPMEIPPRPIASPHWHGVGRREEPPRCTCSGFRHDHDCPEVEGPENAQ